LGRTQDAPLLKRSLDFHGRGVVETSFVWQWNQQPIIEMQVQVRAGVGHQEVGPLLGHPVQEGTRIVHSVRVQAGGEREHPAIVQVQHPRLGRDQPRLKLPQELALRVSGGNCKGRIALPGGVRIVQGGLLARAEAGRRRP